MQLNIELSTRHIQFVRLDVHYLNHHTNGQLAIYGNELLTLIPPDETGIDVTYDVTPTEINFLYQDDERCITEEEQEKHENGQVDMHKCLEEYMDSKMDCTLPWLAENGALDHGSMCQYPEEYDTYVKLYSEVMNFDSGSISSVANCTPSCKRTGYSMKHVMTYEKKWENKWQNSTTIHFYFGKDRFTVKRQYYTYDFQNFLADFGGYLGLLLGYSILGFYDTLVKLVKLAYDKKWA